MRSLDEERAVLIHCTSNYCVTCANRAMYELNQPLGLLLAMCVQVKLDLEPSYARSEISATLFYICKSDGFAGNNLNACIQNQYRWTVLVHGSQSVKVKL